MYCDFHLLCIMICCLWTKYWRQAARWIFHSSASGFTKSKIDLFIDGSVMDLNPDGQFVGLVIIHSITAFGASKGYKMISSLIKTYQDLFPPPSDRDTISLLSCSGEKMCLKRRICEIFYEKYYENFTKNHNHDAYWKGRGRTVGFNQRTAASLIHLPPRNKSHLWTQLCSCWSQASDFILYGK